MSDDERKRKALKFDWLTRFYDPFMMMTGADKRFGNALLKQAGIKHGDIILDFGCGTGTLLIMAKSNIPCISAHGVDIDFGILKIASEKAKQSTHLSNSDIYSA
jgi:ubiquinone/menaquinone biosynthesis C-methylase UbiE